MIQSRYAALVPSLVVVLAAGLLLAQGTPGPAQNTPEPVPQKVFIVNGREIPGPVVQLAGHYYVSVETLAQITNGTLTMDGNRIALAIPSTVAAPAAAQVAPAQDVLSRDFAREAISALAEMREWKAALATVITFGIPVVGNWPDSYRNLVQDGLGRARLAAITDADHNGLALLEAEAANLMSWSSDVVSQRQALNAARSVDPNALGNDALYKKIDACAQFLSGMISSGRFSDNANCH